eukprot:460935-Amorphochlora_amoeboformis.AAC.1
MGKFSNYIQTIPNLARIANQISSSELILACKHGHVDTASALLESRSDPATTLTTDSIDVDGRSALSWACTSSNIELVRLLLSFKANVDTLQYSGYGSPDPSYAPILPM